MKTLLEKVDFLGIIITFLKQFAKYIPANTITWSSIVINKLWFLCLLSSGHLVLCPQSYYDNRKMVWIKMATIEKSALLSNK